MPLDPLPSIREVRHLYSLSTRAAACRPTLLVRFRIVTEQLVLLRSRSASSNRQQGAEEEPSRLMRKIPLTLQDRAEFEPWVAVPKLHSFQVSLSQAQTKDLKPKVGGSLSRRYQICVAMIARIGRL